MRQCEIKDNQIQDAEILTIDIGIFHEALMPIALGLKEKDITNENTVRRKFK